MTFNRRQFVFSASVSGTFLGPRMISAQSGTTSGGLGLRYEDVASLYTELPVGQSFRNFEEPETGAVLFVDFGQDDLAQSIWISGELDETQVSELVAWLCPDDVEMLNSFALQASAGSIATQHCQTLESAFLGEVSGGRSVILASYVMELANPGVTATNFWISLEQPATQG